ncbi:TRZ/ATZ family hydrolase [Biformimicrobium ophioploci]|uniref:TRZ/ATZ family hydrolase n=2 Tax=Biformimicrobium ophioploci TaxID=3036711 RepID=A0ABQ6LXR9_9GAMM|nr:TRZ/ATZ family hydrolase [Microbulbifer sp. NKW57]
MPGLVNGHTHTSMTLFRGMVDDLDLMTWLNQYVFPLEGQFVDPEFVRIGTELACLEMIRGGTTTFVDMYFYPDVIADVTERCGLRAVVGAPMIDYPSPGFKGWEDSFAAGRAFVSARQGKHERITPAFAPHAPYTVVPEHLEQVLAAAKELNAPISMHLAEAPAETKMIRENYGTTPVAHVEELGMLDHTLIAAHMVQPTKAEIRMLPGHPVGAIHNPTSNLKLAAGIAPVPEMLAAGAKVGLGTDGAASNNDLDLWEEMRLAALLHKARLSDPTVMPAISALRMATSGGAAAIGMGESVGKLAPGMRADMIQVSLENTRLVPLYNVISHLVYAVKSDDVVTTVVSGKVLMENGRVLSLDAGKVRAAARQKAVEIAKAIAAGEKDRSSSE